MQLLPDTAQGIAVRTGGDRIRRRATCSTRRSTSATARGTSGTSSTGTTTTCPRPSPRTTPARETSTRWRRRGVGIQFPETRTYVKRVLDAEKVYADAYGDELSGA